ncbi:hypothetical protein MXD81_44860 [Microbacteriaceae bacterium K1510]|nr:hypothetical protein [Microbacteriaceae bacterium K1510]
MIRPKTLPYWRLNWKFVEHLYDALHMFLWAALLAVVFFMSIFVLPKLPEMQAQAALKRADEIAAENRLYCEKWGFAPGSHKHTMCTVDLQHLRKKIEQHAAEDDLL